MAIEVSEGTREEGLLIDSCKHVTVRRVHYGGRGLGFVLASGDGAEGRSVRLPNMHILLEHSYFSGGVVMVSAMAGGNFNVTYRHLELDGKLARRDGSEGMPGLKIHARPDTTGGETKDVLMEHIRFRPEISARRYSQLTPHNFVSCRLAAEQMHTIRPSCVACPRRCLASLLSLSQMPHPASIAAATTPSTLLRQPFGRPILSLLPPLHSGTAVCFE